MRARARTYVLAGAETRVGESVMRAARGSATPSSRWRRRWAASKLRGREEAARRDSFDRRRTGRGGADTDEPFQIRNSNSISLAAQVTLAGGEPVMSGNCAGQSGGTCARESSRALEADIVVLSGGVSVGKYDLVEQVLRDLGAEFFFDAVAIRPGKPAVFGCCHEQAGVRTAGKSGFDDGDV